MQDLEKFKNEMNLSGQNVYVGHRYKPKMFGEWDNTQIYEPLSIVQYQGNSFTSRQYVPSGVEINNEEYWVSTGNYNAQVEQYRQEVRNLGNNINNVNSEVIAARNGEATLSERLDKDNQEINTQLASIAKHVKQFGAVGDGVNDDTIAIQSALDSGYSITFDKNKTYLVKNLNINQSNITINGKNATLKAIDSVSSILFIGADCENVKIENINFIGLADGTNDNPAGINLTRKDAFSVRNESAKNITISDCTFTGFVFGVIANGTTNLEITRCFSSGLTYVPSASAGGYFVLLQTCYDVNIHNNRAVATVSDRHAVYVSANKNLTIDLFCEDIRIENNYFDWTNSAQAGGFEVILALRSAKNMYVKNNTLIGGVGAITLNASYGDIENVIVDSNIIKDVRGNETNNIYAIGVVPSDREIQYLFKNIVIINNTINSVQEKVGGIRLFKTTDFKVADNIVDIAGVNGIGLNIQDSENGVVNSNLLKGNGTSRSGVRLEGNVDKVKIDNYINDFLFKSPELSSATVTNITYKGSYNIIAVSKGDGTISVNNPQNHAIITSAVGDANGVKLFLNRAFDVSKNELIITQTDGNNPRYFYKRAINSTENSILLGIKTFDGVTEVDMSQINMTILISLIV